MSGSVRIEEHSDFVAMAPLRAEWDRLAARAGLSPSHGFDWHSVLWNVHWARRPILAFVARAPEGLVAVVPLKIEAARDGGPLPARILAPLVACYATQGTQLILSEPEEPALEEIVRRIEARSDEWDIWVMVYRRGEGQAALLKRVLKRAGLPFLVSPGERSPYLDVRGTWEEYLASRETRFRQDLRRIESRLRKQGEVVLQIVDGGGEWRKALDALYEIEAASWKQQAGTAITRVEHQSRFYREYAEIAAAASDLRLSLLVVGGEPVASEFALLRDRTYYMLKSSYKAAWRPYSPGMLRRRMLFEHLFRQGVGRIEFLGDAESHKMKWTDHVHEYVYNRRLRSRLFRHRRTLSRWLSSR
jgi:CelD/BcsL family acetyltransferase involved in cellulose biosynthesis